MTGKAKQSKSTTEPSNSEAFERDLRERHHERDLYKPGRYTRRFTVTEGIPLREEDHEANRHNVIETARNEGVRTSEDTEDVTLDSDQYLDDGRRELLYSVPVVEVMATESTAAAGDDREYGSYDPHNSTDLD
jgi:hypothetical protein